MPIHVQRRTILAAALVGAAVAALAVSVSWSQGAGARDLPLSSSWEQGNFTKLAPGLIYRANNVSPMPAFRAPVAGWSGTQVVSHQRGKPRFESAAFLGHGGEIDLTTGPAMTLSPAGAIAAPRTRIPHWNFAPYDPPTAVQHWTLAGRPALYFDATAPPPGVWTLVGSNPPELRIDHDRTFRMAAVSVRGKTVVVVIQTAAGPFTAFLPQAVRFLGSLSFPA